MQGASSHEDAASKSYAQPNSTQMRTGGGEEREVQESRGPSQPAGSEDERRQQVRADIEARTAAILEQGPAYLASRSLNDFNAEAVAAHKQGEHAAAVATYQALFSKAQASNLTHPELYTCHSNCAAACLELRLFPEALRHADRCQQLAEASLRRNFKASGPYIKSFLRKGEALLGMGCSRQAAATLDAGLKLDPFSLDLKAALQEAHAAVLRDVAQGRERQTLAIEYPEAHQRISYHPYSAPLHRIKTDDMLPLKLLTPFQAENDHHIKDTYNYVTVQTDVKMPRRHLAALADSPFNAAFQSAIEAAVQAAAAEDKDVRVLNLGAGAGLHAMMALRAGAHHVTAVERWLYLALACKETLAANQFTEAQYRAVYKRPTDLKLLQDVPVCCNLLVANVLDEGLLTSGLVPAVHHALESLLTADAVVLPASATVYMQAVELRTGDVCGLDMSAANLYRWHPAYAAGVPLAGERIVALSEPQEVWYFDLGTPPDRSGSKAVDVTFIKRGRFNAVRFWYKLHLYGDVYLSTGPEAVEEGLCCLQPALQYIAGELSVDAGMVLPVMASHNTVRMRFDVESAEFLNLMRPDAAFPQNHFAMLADEARCQAYERAIARAVKRQRGADGEAHVLDTGCGTGILSLLAARAGADSVVACDLHESVCDVARRSAAHNGLSSRVSVVHCDAGMLQRGREVRQLGINLVVADMFDAGLLGDSFAYALDLARKRVVQPGAVVVPAGATLYCMGVEARTGRVAGFDLSPMDTYRWDAAYEAVDASALPHRRLTKPAKVFEQWFDGERKPRGRESLLKLEGVAEGVLNAVVFWFDLHLDEEETLSNAPDGIGVGGVLLPESSCGGAPAAAQGAAAAEVPSTPEQQGPAAAAADAPAAAWMTGAAAAEQALAAGGAVATGKPADDFLPAAGFEGARPGCAFKLGPLGLGYYREGRPAGSSSSSSSDGESGGSPRAAAAAAECAAAEHPAPQPGGSPGPRHHWGQALQYLDAAVEVVPGRRATLLARREEGRPHFALRQGVGTPVPRAPWKIEWGGGASVENPHFQRVHYCDLLVRDFLQRVRSRRFPPIEQDLRMVLAHCGSLLLDPAALQEVYHELVVLERLHLAPNFSPAASLEALTKRPLRLC